MISTLMAGSVTLEEIIFPRADSMENRTSRLTLLIDPDKKRIFEEICAAQDLTPSQVVRRLIRQYMIDHAGNRELPAWLVANTPQRAPLQLAGNDQPQAAKPDQAAANVLKE
ncbi:MAG: hypothetical protein WC100_15105 [Sterolibacterium sp.]